jgi:hypothetical protein
MGNYRATPKQWEKVENWSSEMSSTDSCVLELRARVMALEAQANHIGDINKMVPPPVASTLVDRVKLAIDEAPFDEGEHQWNEARYAILEVARWMRERGWFVMPDVLEQEAGR